MEDVESLKRALFDVQTRNFVLENQVADLAGGQEGSRIHEELLATRESLVRRDEELQACERKLGGSKEEVRQLKQLLVKARGTIGALEARASASDAEAVAAADELHASRADADALRKTCAAATSGARRAVCGTEALCAALADADAEFAALLAAHVGYASEIEATKQTARRTAAHGSAALSDATGEVARLRVDGSKLRGRVAALDAELARLREQLRVREREGAATAAAAANGAAAAAVLEVQLSAAREQGSEAAAQLARAHAELDARALALAERNAELERARALGEAATRRRAAADADSVRREQRCAALEAQLAVALSDASAARAALDAARSAALGAELGSAAAMRAVVVDFAQVDVALGAADARARAELAGALARGAAEAAEREREAAARVRALEAELGRTRAELGASDRRLADATLKLGASAKAALQVRALQAHVSDLSDKLAKKAAMCERLLKRAAPATAAGAAAGGADAADAADGGTPRALPAAVDCAPCDARARASSSELAADPPSAGAARRPASRARELCGHAELCGKENLPTSARELCGKDNFPTSARAPCGGAAGDGGGGGGDDGDDDARAPYAASRAPSVPRSSSRSRSGPLHRPSFQPAGRRTSGALALPARQSDRSVLTPRAGPPCPAPGARLTPARRAGGSCASSDVGRGATGPHAGGACPPAAPALPGACAVADGCAPADARAPSREEPEPANDGAEAPARERRKSGVKLVPSRYLDLGVSAARGAGVNVTTRSASRR